MEEKQKALTRNVSIYPDEWQLLQDVAKQIGQRSRSAGLHFIIRDWLRITGREQQGKESDAPTTDD